MKMINAGTIATLIKAHKQNDEHGEKWEAAFERLNTLYCKGAKRIKEDKPNE